MLANRDAIGSAQCARCKAQLGRIGAKVELEPELKQIAENGSQPAKSKPELEPKPVSAQEPTPMRIQVTLLTCASCLIMFSRI